MDTTSTWQTASGGDWNTPTDWAGGVPDQVTTDATIAHAGNYTVVISYGEGFDVGSVDLDSPDATLEVADASTLTLGGTADTFMLTAGTLQLEGALASGTLVAAGGVLSLQGDSLFDGMTVLGGLTFGYEFLDVVNGLTVETAGGQPGTISLNGGSDGLAFGDSETLDNVTLLIGEVAADSIVTVGTLTLGSDAAVIQTQGSAVFAGSFVNQGTISLGGGAFNEGGNTGTESFSNAGLLSLSNTENFTENVLSFSNSATIALAGSSDLIAYSPIGNTTGATFTNSGTITLADASGLTAYAPTFSNSGSIDIGDGSDLIVVNATMFSNTGTITIENGGTLDLDAETSLGEPGTIISDGGTLVLRGSLDLDGGTLDLKSAGLAGNLVLSGHLANGTLRLDGEALIPQGGLLNDVTVQGGLTFGFDQTLSVMNVTVESASGGQPGTISMTSGLDYLYFDASQTLDNVTLQIGDAYFDEVHASGPGFGVTVTFGADAQVIQTQGSVAFYESFVNQGTFSLGGGIFTYRVAALDEGFTNAGLLNLSNNELFTAIFATFSNVGTILAADGSTVGLQLNEFVNLSSGTLTGGAYAVDNGSTLQFTANADDRLVVDAANVTLNGAGSSIEFYGTVSNGYQTVETTLQEIASGGTLAVLGGRDYTTGNGVANAGLLALGGGSFAAASLTNTGTIEGSGTIAGAVDSAGTINASFALLDIAGAVTDAGVLLIEAAATLELGGATEQSTTFLSGNTAAGGTLKIDVASSYTGQIDDFGVTDTIDLANLVLSAASITATGTLVADISGGGMQTFTVANNFVTGILKVAADGVTGTDITAPVCFLAGTRIGTPDGEVLIESLAIGDRVSTLSGAARPIVWIGKGRVLATRARRNAATPVIVRKNALADNVPHADLRVTKAHAIYIDDVLIPVEFLVNHRSILWDDHAQEVTIYHVELETHDVLLANGAPAESYRDDGNRWLFRNANSGWGLSPQQPCASVLTGGPVVDAVWQRLVDRAGMRLGVPTTDDPDLHVLVDGLRMDAASRSAALYVFRLTAKPATVRIVSRASSPQELGLARDPRSLGVAVRRIIVTHSRKVRTIEAEDPALALGFHGFEEDNAIRWTNGDAAIPAALFDGFTGHLELALCLGGTTRYVDVGITQRVA
jgi:hypothetical protein